jgi:hypothetical protein
MSVKPSTLRTGLGGYVPACGSHEMLCRMSQAMLASSHWLLNSQLRIKALPNFLGNFVLGC